MIQINLLRISPDSKYLEFSVECPLNYRFNKLYIKKYDYVPNISPVDTYGNPTDDGWRDCSYLLQATSEKEVMRISTVALSSGFNNGAALTIAPDNQGKSASTMFYVQFGVWDYSDLGLDPITDIIGVTSDLNNVYIALKDDLLNLDANCLTQDSYQKLLRNYMFIYAHVEAMRLERFDEAEMFYDIIKKQFVSCTPSRSDNYRSINTCNCN